MSDFKVGSITSSQAPAGQPANLDNSGAGDNDNIVMPDQCVIRVLGVGGGGGNALQHMINDSINGVEFIAVNTDSQALRKSTAPLKVQIGVKLTNGLGAGCDPNKGKKAAEESKEDLKKLLSGSEMVFITAGMGGGTGTGAAPVIAEIAKETGALTVAVVTKPFTFEGRRHKINAESGISELSKHVDSLIVIDNDKLLKNLGPNTSLVSAFNCANDVLLNAVKGITDIITIPSFINMDFADVKTVMEGRGHAIIGSGVGQGANFVHDAIENAIHSPLIETVDISSAAGLLANIIANPNFPITQYNELCDAISAYASTEADCKFGLRLDDSVAEDQIKVTILITGISEEDRALPGSGKNADPAGSADARLGQSGTQSAAAAAQTRTAQPSQGQMRNQAQVSNQFAQTQANPQQYGNRDFFASFSANLGEREAQTSFRTQNNAQIPSENNHFQSQNSGSQVFAQHGFSTAQNTKNNFNPSLQPHEIRVNDPVKGPAEDNRGNDLWELPPILRNRSE